jgi:hypothetical protein
MTMLRIARAVSAAAVALAVAPLAHATFHAMQIQQVIGGVNGNTAAQAIQLRTRSMFQNFVSAGRLKAFDAQGNNAVLLLDITTDVSNTSPGAFVLIATSAFQTSPAITPDFIMANPIPASYLAAGSLTWEDDFGTIYWRICWGGSAYTGPTNVAFTNDIDGTTGAPFAGPLPSTSLQALAYTGAVNGGSTTTAADYVLTAGAAVFTNDGNHSGTVIPIPPVCPADIAHNGAVDVNDLLAVISTWGPCAGTCPPNCTADIVPNCAVDVNDLLTVISTWGPCR